MSERPCQWNDVMFDASTMGLPIGRPASYGRAMRSYQRQCEKRRKQQRKAKRKAKP